MRKEITKTLGMMGTILFTAIILIPSLRCETVPTEKFSEVIKLPGPRFDSSTSVESALSSRRSVRHFQDEPISLPEISQLLWAAQGITDPRGFRTTPSAGALYPLEVYIVAGKIKSISAGVYKYNPRRHELLKIAGGDKRNELSRAALNQGSIRNAAAVVVFGGVYERTTAKYGQRGVRYVFMEAGHAAQNVFLQAISLGLGTVVVGAFNDNGVKEVLNFQADEYPFYIMPIGKPPSEK